MWPPKQLTAESSRREQKNTCAWFGNFVLMPAGWLAGWLALPLWLLRIAGIVRECQL